MDIKQLAEEIIAELIVVAGRLTSFVMTLISALYILRFSPEQIVVKMTGRMVGIFLLVCLGPVILALIVAGVLVFCQ